MALFDRFDLWADLGSRLMSPKARRIYSFLNAIAIAALSVILALWGAENSSLCMSSTTSVVDYSGGCLLFSIPFGTGSAFLLMGLLMFPSSVLRIAIGYFRKGVAEHTTKLDDLRNLAFSSMLIAAGAVLFILAFVVVFYS